MQMHPETAMRVDELGSRFPPYLPTHPLSGAYVDAWHEELSRSQLRDGVLVQLANGAEPAENIPGWLRLADALKLYEMAFFSDGDILELGCYHGLSTCIMSRAVQNCSQLKHIETVDLDPGCSQATSANLRSLGLDRFVSTHTNDAMTVVRHFAAKGRHFGFVFIDHSHAYGPVLDVCRELATVMKPGAFCLFHDFNDIRNQAQNDPDYGVYQAVIDGLDSSQFEFCGIYGCAALYRLPAMSVR